MKKFTVAVIALLTLTLLMTGCGKKEGDGVAGEFKYHTAEEIKDFIEKDEDIILLDIQPEEDWDKHHIKGAIATYAFPADDDEGKAKLDEVLPTLEESEDKIIIICPRGGGGAENTHKYLVEKGIKEDRLYILEKGQEGWPYDELLED